ncbi:TSL-kinase interacting protein 1 [Impatiens glandulifera]|uniref:TSL-kinase interacting protein 1 n=1 Tax=Impatiens glandulifera TaxID=253017 RepID=UPI001FB0FF56|nr:TSL-kinase interacting protein 1 [Impatiens glandulifera]
MKTTKRLKEKRVPAPKKPNAVVSCSGVKKPRARIEKQNKMGINKNQQDAQLFQQVTVTGVSSHDAEVAHKSESFDVLNEKIKLQLFPIDEKTRIALEKDGHNPFLELTLRARKKISSVLKHLHSKWGASFVAAGEPILYPYNIQLGQLNSYEQWTMRDNNIMADFVFKAVGRPSIFRLRYGWSSKNEVKGTVEAPILISSGDCSMNVEGRKNETPRENSYISIRERAYTDGNQHMLLDQPAQNMDAKENAINSLAKTTMPWDDNLSNLSLTRLITETSFPRNTNSLTQRAKGNSLEPLQLISSDISMGALLSEASMQNKIDNIKPEFNAHDSMLNPEIWDGGLSNLSLGGLFSDLSMLGKLLGSNSDKSKSGSQDPFTTYPSNLQPSQLNPSSNFSHSSILDAEETCHAFNFRKTSLLGKDAAHSSLKGQAELGQQSSPNGKKKLLPPQGQYNHSNYSRGLADIKWNDSLGPH